MNAIAEPDFRRLLVRYAEKRLPRADAEDVVQEALCDAMSAARRPDDDGEQRRWLMTILKRRICDWYRAQRLSPPSLEAADVRPENAIVARDLLRRIDREVGDADRRTLDWLVREHHGESLKAIAEDERFPAPALRQRIHRLRTALRAHHLAAAALALALVVGLGAAHRSAEIARDPASTFVVGDARGLYRVESFRLDDASPADRVVAESLRFARVRVEGDRITVEGARALTLFVAARPSDGAVVFRTASGPERATVERASDGSLVVRSSGRFKGELHLHAL